MENHANTNLTSFFFFCCVFNDKIIQVYTSLTSLYNGFVDLLMKYISYTGLYNGFVDSVCPDVMLEHSGHSPPQIYASNKINALKVGQMDRWIASLINGHTACSKRNALEPSGRLSIAC